MRNRFAETVLELALDDPRVAVLVADISPAGAMDEFRSRFPDRFVNLGVAEQVMTGMAAGMALRGYRPFTYTIATFALFRPFEMVRDDICYQNLPVTVVGIGGGVIYSTLGGTHYAQEDVALARAMPNMTVVSPCDAEECAKVTRWLATRDPAGPAYLRLGKAGEPTLTRDAAEPFVAGRVRYLRRGSDVCLIGYGVLLGQAIAAADVLEGMGHSVSVISAHTLKPLDEAGLTGALLDHDAVVVVEEAAPVGSLGESVAAIAHRTGNGTPVARLALKDAFVHCYGSHQDILSAHGIGVRNIVDLATKTLSKD